MSKWNHPLVPVDFPSPPRWAIAQLIHDIVGNDRKRRSAVIHALGYSKPGRAALRFDHLIRTGECSAELRAHLPAALGVSQDVVDAAFAETEAQHTRWRAECEQYNHERERLRFVPRLVLHHDISKRKVPIFVLAFYGQRRLTWVEIPPEVLDLAYEDQLKALPDLLAQWQTTRDGGFSTDWLGQPRGFAYKPEYDLTVLLDAEFGLLSITDGPLPESEITLHAQNRDLLRVLSLGDN